MRKQRGWASIAGILFIIVLIIILVVCFNLFKKNYFNGFEKATVELTKTTIFERDSKVKYSKTSSYKIENVEENDATFYKEIDVEPNTPYRLTCMIKTENIKCHDEKEDGGASVGLLETTEYSEPIIGTNDWQKVEFLFNSKNREKVKISFRLGGNQNTCTGTAWFSDFKLEKGVATDDANWKMGCFIIDELNVEVEGQQYDFKVNGIDKENVELNMERYKRDCNLFTNGLMKVDYEINEIKEPITTISYSEEHGYYIDYKDVKDAIYDIVKEKEYDHIFVICRMEDDEGTSTIPIKDNWIGLGSMDMYGVGYSLVRINRNANSYNYKYGITNQAPEEVYLHEFLHTLERNTIEKGYKIPALHDFDKYNYTEKTAEGLMQWYKDYMSGNIQDKFYGGLAGLNTSAYKTQPPNNSRNFKYPIEIDFNDEPSNIFEDLFSIVDAVKKGFSK